MPTDNVSEVLGTADVAELFHVDPRTVAKWVRKGKLRSFRTPGGHIRFLRAEVEALRATGVTDDDEPEAVGA